MKKTLLTLSFSALAAMAQEPATPPPTQGSLSPILMYVADRSSADKAAIQVNELIKQLGTDKIKVDPYDLMLLRAGSCFGSTALQQAMAPFLPAIQADEAAEIEPYLATLNEIWQAMDDMSATLNGITDARTAHDAAETLENFVPFMSSCAEKICTFSTPEQIAARRELNIVYKVGNRVRVARFLQAWGHLITRSENYYDSERLIEALLGVRDVFENMGMQIDPHAIPAVMKVADELKGLMQQWVKQITLVNSYTSAQQAAPHLQSVKDKIKTVSITAGLNKSHEEDLFLYSPELELLAHVMDRISHYLQEEVNPPFYGSADLQSVLEHED